MPKEYLTTAQAAQALGVTMSRVRQLVAAGLLEAHKPTGQGHLITAASVKAARDRPGKGRPVTKRR